MPAAMHWKAVGGVQYLAVKDKSHSNGTTEGRRSAETEQRLGPVP